jgi:hypothetical protein
MRSAKRVGTTVLGAALVVACSSSTGLSGQGQSVSLSFAGRIPGFTGIQAMPSIVDAAGDSMVVTGGGNTVVIKTVDLVLRKVELKRASVAGSCDSMVHVDDCGEFESGSVLVSVPLAAGAVTAVAVPIDSGSYKSIEFKIHKPGNDAVDLAFAAANPTWPANTSIRVTGTFNGTPFTYTTSLDVEQESTFNPPLVVTASGTATNLTLRMDISKWFLIGGTAVDPASANTGQPNESAVQNAIKNSFKAFRDENHDGDETNG